MCPSSVPVEQIQLTLTVICLLIQQWKVGFNQVIPKPGLTVGNCRQSVSWCKEGCVSCALFTAILLSFSCLLTNSLSMKWSHFREIKGSFSYFSNWAYQRYPGACFPVVLLCWFIHYMEWVFGFCCLLCRHGESEPPSEGGGGSKWSAWQESKGSFSEAEHEAARKDLDPIEEVSPSQTDISSNALFIKSNFTQQLSFHTVMITQTGQVFSMPLDTFIMAT